MVRMQTDIRDLPWVVNYNGIHCTVRTIIYAEDFSGFAPVWHLLPAKRMDTHADVVGVNYTSQKVRGLAAIMILGMQKRFRALYADNGAQFMEAALGPYMPFLVSDGEDPSVLINRDRLKPRGGGHIENILGQLNKYVELLPGSYDEKQYRRSFRRAKRLGIPDFQDMADNFDAVMNSWNYDRVDGKPSCYDKLKDAPDWLYSMSSATNLSVYD